MSDRPLRHVDLWHTGIVVDDLTAAMDELGEDLGVTWHQGGAEVHLVTDGNTQIVKTAYALSKEGPHHVELTQSIEGTVWTTVAPGHAHHLGYWVDDVSGVSASLEDDGWPLAAAVTMSDDSPPICAYHRARHGLYVEVVSRALRSVLLPSK